MTLNPLGDATLGALRRGEQIHSGLLADFVGDARKLARLGLPVYSLGGGAGYLWGADFDDFGKGSLRITAVDASALEELAGAGTRHDGTRGRPDRSATGADA